MEVSRVEKRVDDVAGSIGRDIDRRSKLTGQRPPVSQSRGACSKADRGANR